MAIITAATLPSELKRIQLRSRRLVTGDLLGQYRSAFRGTGLIFSDLREYQPGDEIKQIHWKATARTGTVFVKSYEEDRQLRMMLAVDSSPSMFASWGHQSFSKVIEFCSLIGYLGQRGNDLLGLMMFSEQVDSYLPPKAGPKSCSRIIAALQQQHSAKPAKATNLALACEHLSSTLRRASIVFIVSDFECPPADQQLASLCARHDVILVQIQPPASSLLAAGLVRFRDAETGQECMVDTSSKRVQTAWLQVLAQRREAVHYSAQQCGADHIVITDSSSAPLLQLMKQRVRRIIR